MTEEMGTVGTLNSIRNALTTVIITGLQRKLAQSLRRAWNSRCEEAPPSPGKFPFVVLLSPPTWSTSRDGHCKLLTIPPTVPPGGTKE